MACAAVTFFFYNFHHNLALMSVFFFSILSFRGKEKEHPNFMFCIVPLVYRPSRPLAVEYQIDSMTAISTNRAALSHSLIHISPTILLNNPFRLFSIFKNICVEGNQNKIVFNVPHSEFQWICLIEDGR